MVDISYLSRLDSFPYRHRLMDVMAAPVLTGPGDLTVSDVCARMNASQTSSLVIIDAAGIALGIFTERDLLAAITRLGAAALQVRVEELMSSPLQCVPGDSYLYVGIARMTRLGIRHLVVVDRNHRPIGMITGRALLKVRCSDALMIGDDIAQAQSGTDMARTHNALPALARSLLDEGVSARDIAGIISSVLRDITSRSAELVEQAMASDGWGPAPAPWALLVLGSGGRGESLLTFDQDNAIVHRGTAADDPWYAECGRRLNDLLNLSGIPYCSGDVMARNPQWRRSLEEWMTEIRHWVFDPQMQTVLNVDIFFDFVPVHGDRALAQELKEYAVETAATSAFFLQFLGVNVSRMDVPLTIFGKLRTSQGRLDAKKFGLMPLVGAARAKAVGARILESGTAARYTLLNEKGLLHADDLSGLQETHETILAIMLNQQLLDITEGIQPSTKIDPRKLSGQVRQRLVSAFQRIATLKTLLGGLAS